MPDYQSSPAYSARTFKSVLDVREQHESELDTEFKVLDELTLVNSHFVILCDYCGNVCLNHDTSTALTV